MSVKYHNFGGWFGWTLQKYFPKLSAASYLKLQFASRNKKQKEYIDYFLSTEEPPQPLMHFALQTKTPRSVRVAGWMMSCFIR